MEKTHVHRKWEKHRFTGNGKCTCSPEMKKNKNMLTG
jgi:hypothetical protein